jgi:hypothetical protein
MEIVFLLQYNLHRKKYEKHNNVLYYKIDKKKCCIAQHNTNSNMTSFFRFANKRAIYLDGKISLAHERCTHLSQVIKITK